MIEKHGKIVLTEEDLPHVRFWNSAFVCVVYDDLVVEIVNLPNDMSYFFKEYLKKEKRIELRVVDEEYYGDLVVRDAKMIGAGKLYKFAESEN